MVKCVLIVLVVQMTCVRLQETILPLPGPFGDSCSYEEIIERKRQAVKVQLLAKLGKKVNLSKMSNNTRSDIPSDVLRQISHIYQTTVRGYDESERHGRQRDDTGERPPIMKEKLIFPEQFERLSSNTLRYVWSTDGLIEGTRAKVHIPIELANPSLRIFVINSPHFHSEARLHREATERLYGGRLVELTKHWRRWALRPDSNHGLLLCQGRCFDGNRDIEVFGAKPYVNIEIPASSESHRAPRAARYNASPQSCNRFPDQCCYKHHYLSFKELGLENQVLEPKEFNAGLCMGTCSEMWLERYHHSHIMNYFKNDRPEMMNCCAPASVTDLKVIVWDHDSHSAIMTVLPSVVVTECCCK